MTKGELTRVYRGHTNAVYAVAWASDGVHLASGGDDASVQVWDVVTGNTSWTHVHPCREHLPLQAEDDSLSKM